MYQKTYKSTEEDFLQPRVVITDQKDHCPSKSVLFIGEKEHKENHFLQATFMRLFWQVDLLVETLLSEFN